MSEDELSKLQTQVSRLEAALAVWWKVAASILGAVCALFGVQHWVLLPKMVKDALDVRVTAEVQKQLTSEVRISLTDAATKAKADATAILSILKEAATTYGPRLAEWSGRYKKSDADSQQSHVAVFVGGFIARDYNLHFLFGQPLDAASDGSPQFESRLVVRDDPTYVRAPYRSVFRRRGIKPSIEFFNTDGALVETWTKID